VGTDIGYYLTYDGYTNRVLEKYVGSGDLT
jgi:hypothetical protein